MGTLGLRSLKGCNIVVGDGYAYHNSLAVQDFEALRIKILFWMRCIFSSNLHY